MKSEQPFVHELALVEDGVEISAGTRVWAGAHLRAGARIGSDCVIGRDVTVDRDVVVGDRCKLQNGALLYRGVRLEEGVFIGPGAILTNDRRPRAIAASGDSLAEDGWEVSPILVERGASIGANATVVAGVRIGAWAMVGAGAVLSRDAPPFGLMVGVPARHTGWVCACGAEALVPGRMACAACRGGEELTPRAEPG